MTQSSAPGQKIATSSNISPDKLLQLFVVISIVSLIVILVLATYGIYGVYSRHVIADAEEDSVAISEAILEQEWYFLMTIDMDGNSMLSIEDTNIPELDASLRHFLSPFDIVKIKIYNLEKEIIYSTDPTIIGEIDTKNPRLERALNGNNDVHIEKKESILDLADEKVFDVDVAETYVPISIDNGEVVGSFEIYKDITKYRAEIISGVATSIIILAAILSAVFVAAFSIVAKATYRLKVAEERLGRLATVDTLTGLWNRREIMNRARQEFARAVRHYKKDHPTPLSFIMIDIDKFKNINDTYGHPVGDEVLRELGNRLSSGFRKYDTIGRYGGEEFIVVLPGCTLTEAQAAAERTRHLIKDRSFIIGSLSLDITISLGISCTDGSTEDDLKAIINRADQGLYKAKNEGRDRVAWLDEDISVPA